MNNKIYKQQIRQLFACATALLVLVCSCHAPAPETEIPSYTFKDSIITLADSSPIVSKIHVHPVEEKSFSQQLVTAGIVKTIPNSYAEIAPPFAGRVLRSFIKLGQTVQIGTPIFEMSSPAYFAAQKEYADAQQEYKQAELNWRRQQDLIKHGVGVQRELEEAETLFQMQKAALSNASAALKIFQVDPKQVQLGQPLIIRSPIAGEIVTNNIVIGQYVKEDADALAVVAELSKVWIAGQVKEKDLPRLAGLLEVQIQVPAFPNEQIKGQIFHINENVDEDTRSVEVLVACENNKRVLRPGMYVSSIFGSQPKNTLLIPTKAIMQKDNTQYVFVQVGDKKFKKRIVTTDGTHNDMSIIESGLQAGEHIVSDGATLLLQAL